MSLKGLAVLGAAVMTANVAIADIAELEIRFQAKPDHAGGPNGGDDSTSGGGGKGKNKDTSGSVPELRFWMQEDVAAAWADGFLGQGVTVTVIDDFTSNTGIYGTLGDGTELLRHGEWTYKQSSLISPEASMKAQDFTSGDRVRLRRGLNVMNLSYGMFAADGYSLNQIGWSNQEQSLIDYAWAGEAILAKAAGNDAVAVGAATSDGAKDYLASALIGAPAALFVGALDANGSVSNPVSLASYSNYAGSSTAVQEQFLTVGVEGSETGLYGTSFAAPIVSGYAAILGSKFTSANANAIAKQLLDTARTDTIIGYDPSIHGQGEASISRALAPVSVE